MSGRMTEERLDALVSQAYQGGVSALAEEARRARASEDQKDSVIKALADALVTVRERHRSLPAGRSPMSPSDLRAIDAALRLAGRLP